MNPVARERVESWEADIAQTIPQMSDLSPEQLKNDVLKFLSHEEQILFKNASDKIDDWIKECSQTGICSFAAGEPEIGQHVLIMKKLLCALYLRKEKEELHWAEVEKHRPQFMAQMQNEMLDAKAYLDPREYKILEDGIHGAVDAWLELGPGYQTDDRACNFVTYLTESKRKKRHHEILQAAQAEADKYSHSLFTETEQLKFKFSPKQEAIEYFKQHVSDPRYLGYEFSKYVTETELQDIRNCAQKISSQKLLESISANLAEFIDSKHQVELFLLPSAGYICEQKIPCLDFVFGVFAVISVEIWLKPKQIFFGGFLFDMLWMSQQNNTGQAQSGESRQLGYLYYLLTPDNFEPIPWQPVPLSLIKSMWDNELEPEGVIIIEESEAETVYQVEGFEDEICLPSTFTNYIKQMGNIDKMVEVGIVPTKAAGIVKNKLEQLDAAKKSSSTTNEPSTSSAAITGKITKKKLAYQLFKQEKVPTSPEVKALGLHKSTRCKYYNQWLADGKP